MKYWIFDGRDAQGPFTEEELRRQPGFSLETLVCPDGAASAEQWKPARQYLPANPPAAAPAAAPAPKPAPAVAPRAEPRPEPKPEPRGPMAAERREGPMAGGAHAGPMAGGAPAGPMAAAPQAAAPGQMGRLKPEPVVAGESPEAIRLRKAQELPARRAPDPEPAPEAPAPPPPDRRAEALKKAALAAGAASLLASGFFGGRAVLRKRAAAKAAASVAAAAPAAAAAAAAADAGASPAANEAAGDVAIALVKSFPVQSKGRKRPADPVDALTQKNWRPAVTLGELYDQLALEALALEAASSVERQGHTIAEGEREIRRSPQLWAKRAARFVSRSAPAYSVELNGTVWRVMVSLPTRPGEPPHRFDVDTAARTLKPVDQLSWFDVDPKEASKWGAKYLRLSEEPDQPDGGGPQTPVFRAPAGAGKGAAVARAAAPAPAASEEDDYDDPTAQPAKPAATAAPSKRARRAPAPRRVAKGAAAASQPQAKAAPKSEETYDDPGTADDEKSVQTIFSDADRTGHEPKPLSAEAARASAASAPPASPAPAPAPAPTRQAARPPLPALEGMPPNARPGGEGTIMTPQPSGGASQGKSVTDMSVDELNKYLSRDKK